MARKKVLSKIKRPNGEGSIFRRKDGRWVGYLTIGFDDKGNQRKKIIYGHSQTEVAKKLSEISGRIKSNAYDLIENHTFGELMKEWLLVFKKSAVTARTFEGNIRNFRKHIMPKNGNMKIYEIDTIVIQKVMNDLLDNNYSTNLVKKCKHLLNQFFEYAIDNKWVSINPTTRVKVRAYDKVQNKEQYKALTPELRTKFLEALAKDDANFIKPLCICMMYSGLRVGEAIALKWQNIDFENKTLKIERAITQIPKFDSDGKIIGRTTVVGETKTACSVREIPIVDIVVNTLKEWYEKQTIRQNTNIFVTGDLISKNAFVFANDDGSVRTYSGCSVIFDRWKRRNHLNKLGIHFHGLRHTFSNMLFEINENPKAIQQLLGHKDVKTTITVYNSVNNEYIRNTTNKFNEKIKEEQLILKQTNRNEIIEQRANNLTSDMNDEELDLLQELIQEQKERKRKQECEME